MKFTVGLRDVPLARKGGSLVAGVAMLLCLVSGFGLPVQPVVAGTPCNNCRFANFIQRGTDNTYLQNYLSGGTWTGSQFGTDHPGDTSNPDPITFQFTDNGTDNPNLNIQSAQLKPTPFDNYIRALLTYNAVSLPLGGSNSPYASASGQNLVQNYTKITLSIVADGTQTLPLVVEGIAVPNQYITVPDGANLLTMTAGYGSGPDAIGGELSVLDGSVGSFSGGEPTQTVTFTSDYLNFAGTSYNTFNFAYSGISPTAALSGTFPQQYISDFAAQMVGAFSNEFPAASSPTPTPSPSPTPSPVGSTPSDFCTGFS